MPRAGRPRKPENIGHRCPDDVPTHVAGLDADRVDTDRKIEIDNERATDERHTTAQMSIDPHGHKLRAGGRDPADDPVRDLVCHR